MFAVLNEQVVALGGFYHLVAGHLVVYRLPVIVNSNGVADIKVADVVKESIEFIPVKNVQEVVEKALVRKPSPAVVAVAASAPVEVTEEKDEN